MATKRAQRNDKQQEGQPGQAAAAMAMEGGAEATAGAPETAEQRESAGPVQVPAKEVSEALMAKMDWAQKAISKYDWHCLTLNLSALVVFMGAFGGSFLDPNARALALMSIGTLVLLFTLWVLSSYYQHLKSLYVDAYRRLEAGESVSLVMKPNMRSAMTKALWQPPVSWLFFVLIITMSVRSVLVV